MFGRHDGGVKDVDHAVVTVGEPDFLFIGGHGDAVAGAAVAFDGAHFVAMDFDAVEHFAGAHVADFEAEEGVDIDEAEGLGAVDGEGADGLAEGADGFGDFVGFGVGDGEEGGFEAGHVDLFTVGGKDGVVGGGIVDDGGDDGSGEGVDDVPVGAFEGGDVEDFAVWGEGHAIAAAGEFFIPLHFFGFEVDAGEAFDGGDVEFAGAGAGFNAFYVFRFLAGGDGPRGDAFDEFVVVVNVEDDDADAAVIEVVSNAGGGGVEVVFFVRSGGGGGDGAREESGEGGASGSHEDLVRFDCMRLGGEWG